eukprot:PITA_26138
MKPVLPFITSSEQSNYVEERYIVDGINLAHEAIHSLKTLKKPDMIIKLDMSKAFDKLNWDYIKIILGAFDNIKWDCIKSTLSGSPTNTFQPFRGIRQGDPPSPFLFILMVEGLARATKYALKNGSNKSLTLHDGITLSHQQFVDDTLLLNCPLVPEAIVVKEILDIFSLTFGVSINLDKS